MQLKCNIVTMIRSTSASHQQQLGQLIEELDEQPALKKIKIKDERPWLASTSPQASENSLQCQSQKPDHQHNQPPTQPHQPQQELHQQQQQQQQQQQLPQQLQQQEQQPQQSGDNKPKRNPFCSRCRNHGKSAQVKGHKRHCEYRDCQCDGCKLVECRQIVSAAQIKRRRYQKQDEECGRKIEISAPVLTREHSRDPAALIAKTLIGAATPKHVQQQVSGSVGHHKHSSVMAGAASVLGTASGPLHQLYQQQQAHFRAQQEQHNHLHSHHHHVHGHRSSPHSLSGPPSIGPSLSDTLHLFQFPSSVLSAAAASLGRVAGGSLATSPRTQSNTAVTGAPTLTLSATPTSSLGVSPGATLSSLPAIMTPPSMSTPSFREQVALVEEIHKTCGPLAIYAWLKGEHFDLQKIRETIELARLPFEDLLHMTGHSPPLDLTSPIVD